MCMSFSIEYHLQAYIDLTNSYVHSSKAVSDGAISFHISNRIEQQVVGITYGAKVAIRYDRFSTNREQRRHLVEFWPDGTPYLFAFSKILPKVITNSDLFRKSDAWFSK